MKSKLTKLALMATLGLALTFTFSCSGGDDGGGNGNFEYGSLPYQGKTYKTIKIGSQTWMVENLNIDVSGSKCYDNKPANCDKYGRLYDWATAMKLDISCNSSSCASQIKAKHQGICPEVWHIPSDDDWNVLMKTVNPSCSDNSDCAGAGTKLKSKAGWNEKGNGSDKFGFSALPGGGGDSDGSFLLVGDYGNWWSTSEGSSYYNAYVRYIYYSYESVNWYDYGKDYLFSVRCIKD